MAGVNYCQCRQMSVADYRSMEILVFTSMANISLNNNVIKTIFIFFAIFSGVFAVITLVNLTLQ